MQLTLDLNIPATKPTLKPFLKWVGGKRQLINQITPHLPKTFNNYYEPFIGGGALLFHLLPKQAMISDINHELINVYQCVKKDYIAVVNLLKCFRYDFDFFSGIRGWDKDKDYINKYSPEERTARFIYINKCGFNGLWRVNKNGECNVSFGRYINPDFICEQTLKECSEYLQNVNIYQGDFETTIQDAGMNDFIYLDPPYDPVSITSNFVGYSQNGFTRDDQIRLKTKVDQLTLKGVRIMVSNNLTPFISDLYKDYNQHTLLATRNVNSNGEKRGVVPEILITNY
jgi:DNA adenine methylase